MILTDEKYYFDDYLISKIINELENVISKPDPLKQDSFFMRNYKLISETIFDIFLKSTRIEAKKNSAKFYRIIIDILPKLKHQDTEYQIFVVNKICEIAIHMKTFCMSDSATLIEFYELCRWIPSYIRDTYKLKTLALPCLNLAIEWLHLSSEPKFIELAARILEKKAFYSFPDYIEKFIDFFKLLIALAHKIPEQILTDKNQSIFKDEIKKCIKTFAEQHLSTKTPLTKTVVPLIFKQLISKAISNKIEDDIYFQCIEPLVKLLDFKSFSTDKEDLEDIKKTVSLLVAPEVLESIQPDYKDRFQSINRFYVLFYTQLSMVYESRSDIGNLIEPEIINLISTIDEFDNYENYNDQNVTINFDILRPFLTVFIKHNANYPRIVSFIAPIIFKLRLNHKENNDINGHFSMFISILSGSDILAANAQKIWEIFLTDPNQHLLSHALYTILPKNPDSLTREYAIEYFNFILSQETSFTTFMPNYSLIQVISKCCYNYFFEIRNETKNSIIKDLILKGEELKDPMVLYYVTDIYSKLCSEVNESLYLAVLYELRSEIYRVLFMSDIDKTKKVKIALFADDVVIWITHWNKAAIQSNLQQVTTNFNNECVNLGLEINVKKTTYTLFARNGNRKDFQPKSTLAIELNGEKIVQSLNPVILGITFDPSMNFKYHFTKLIDRCSAKLNLIRILSTYNKQINSSKLILVYKAYILSLIQYSSIPYLYLKENVVRKIESIQTSALRTIFHCSKFVSNASLRQVGQIKPISVVMKRLFINQCQRQSISVSFSEIFLQMQTDIKNDQRLCSKRNNHFSPLAQYSST